MFASRESARGCNVVVISQFYLFGQSADSCPDSWQTYECTYYTYTNSTTN